MDSLIEQYNEHSISYNTRRVYYSGWKTFRDFCSSVGITCLPLSSRKLQRFVVSIASRVSYKSIKVYLAGIQFISLMAGFPTRIQNMAPLFYTLRGIRRVQGSHFTRSPRRPITYLMLRKIHDYILATLWSSHDKLMLQTATSLAFFGLLRCSEYTSPSPTHFDPSVILILSDIAFLRSSPVARLFIKSSKTDPFRIGVFVRIGGTGCRCCPVSLLKKFVKSCAANRPLFSFSSGRFLTRSDIYNLLRAVFPFSNNINTHSFRIGGASAASAGGLPDSRIMILGRWASDAFRRYLRFDDSNFINFSRAMTSQSINSVWDPYGRNL